MHDLIYNKGIVISGNKNLKGGGLQTSVSKQSVTEDGVLPSESNAAHSICKLK